MPAPPQSTSPAAFMPAIATVLRTNLPASTVQVKIVDESTFRGKLTETLMQTGVALCLGSGQPVNQLAGGGRYDYRIKRTLYVGICIESLNDPAGRAEIALDTLWDYEDAVMNILLTTVVPPLVLPLLPADISAETFDLPVDSGRYRNVIGFTVIYPSNVSNACG
jgi:hypothetical protein